MNDRNISIGGNVSGSIIQTGDNNLSKLETITEFPPAEEVNIREEIKALRSILEELTLESKNKMIRALEDAEEEVSSEKPDKDEVGTALERVIKYADKAENYSTKMESLKQKIIPIAAWLGENWHKLTDLFPGS